MPGYTFGKLVDDVCLFRFSALADDCTDGQVALAEGHVNVALTELYNLHPWSFLHVAATLAAASGATTTDLPEDFGSLKGEGLYHAPDKLILAALHRPISFVRQQVAGGGGAAGPPRYFAIEAAPHDADTGTQWRVRWAAPLDGAYTLYYDYEPSREPLEEAAEYPLGGWAFAPCARQWCLAVAERDGARTIGLQTQLAQAALEAARSRDTRRGARNLGQLVARPSPRRWRRVSGFDTD